MGTTTFVALHFPEAAGKLPVPYHIDPEGFVTHQDYWQGTPLQLAGFTASADVQVVTLDADDWLAGDHQSAVGQYPVFIDADGGMWNTTSAINRVTEHLWGGHHG